MQSDRKCYSLGRIMAADVRIGLLVSYLRGVDRGRYQNCAIGEGPLEQLERTGKSYLPSRCNSVPHR